MLSISDCVRQILTKSPQIQDILGDNLLNLSEYARKIKPEVEETSFKKVSLGSIITALGRIQKEIELQTLPNFKATDITIKSPVSEISFIRNESLESKLATVYKNVTKYENNFLNVITGNTEITIFVNSNLETKLIEILNFKPKFHASKLAAISIKFSEDYFYFSGILLQVLTVVCRQKISIYEAISTFTEITLVISQQDLQSCFEVLNQSFGFQK